MSNKRLKRCPNCNGDGVIFRTGFMDADLCGDCKGTGMISYIKESGLNVENKKDIDKYALQLKIVE